jgi:hypothetical protein
MLGVEDVARLALSLPDVTEGVRHGHRTWFVGGRAFAWERPFSKADIKRFGSASPPDGPIVAITVADLNEKEAVLAARTAGVFEIAHFDGYPAVLVALNEVPVPALEEALVDGWLACAPEALAEQYLQAGGPSRPSPR